MWFKILGIALISLIFIVDGIICLRRSFASEISYDLREDIKHTFFTWHWTYSGHHNYDKNRPRRIMSIMSIIGGVGIMLLGFVKLF